MEDNKKQDEDMLQESLSGDEASDVPVGNFVAGDSNEEPAEHDEEAIAADAEALSEETPTVDEATPPVEETPVIEEPAPAEEEPTEDEQETPVVEESVEVEQEEVQPSEDEPVVEPAAKDEVQAGGDPTDLTVEGADEPAEVPEMSVSAIAAANVAEAEESAPPSIADEAATEAMTTHDKSGASTHVAIVIAILVALVLIGLVYAAFLSSSDDTNEPAVTNGASATAEEVVEDQPVEVEADTSPITDEELQVEADQLVTDLEELNDALDFIEGSLDDESLGL